VTFDVLFSSGSNSLVDELDEIFKSASQVSEYVLFISLILDEGETLNNIKSFISSIPSQLVPFGVHKEKIQLLLMEVFIVRDVRFLLYPPFLS